MAYNVRFYPVSHGARAGVSQGSVGNLLHVFGSYVQDWLLYETDFNWWVPSEVGGELANQLWVGHRSQANELLIRAHSLLENSAAAISNYPGGHNEGFPHTFKQLFRSYYGYIARIDFNALLPGPTLCRRTARNLVVRSDPREPSPTSLGSYRSLEKSSRYFPNNFSQRVADSSAANQRLRATNATQIGLQFVPECGVLKIRTAFLAELRISTRCANISRVTIR